MGWNETAPRTPASAVRPCGACRLPRAGRSTQLHPDPARLRIGRADALRLSGRRRHRDRRGLRLGFARSAAPPAVLPAALFVIFARLLLLMPANVGNKPNAYSFAMSYNRYGWSLLSILALILFVPPRDRIAGDWIDVANASLLVVALFYLKVTYFAGGLAFVGLAILISPHIRARLP